MSKVHAKSLLFHLLLLFHITDARESIDLMLFNGFVFKKMGAGVSKNTIAPTVFGELETCHIGFGVLAFASISFCKCLVQ